MRKIKEKAISFVTFFSSSMGIIIIAAIFIFIISKGINGLSLQFITSDYHKKTYNLVMDRDFSYKQHGFDNPGINDSYFSEKWGIALADKVDLEGKDIVEIVYVHTSSPFKKLILESDDFSLENGYSIDKIILESSTNNFISALSKDKAQVMIEKIDSGDFINDMIVSKGGGGIRGSLISTIILIFLTLIIALPIGVASAIYLNEYAKNSKLKQAMSKMIDITSGIPSIIFGLIGATIFIPFMNMVIKSDGGSLASGALTLSLILLPTIIKTTEETLKLVPDSLRCASIALGASKTQTIFKVVLPNAVQGILTAVSLSIGRIIGESAALIYAIGTVINDNVAISQRSTSLSVHIWSLMSGENPNFEASSTIAIIIMLTVLVISAAIKLSSKMIMKKRGLV